MAGTRRVSRFVRGSRPTARGYGLFGAGVVLLAGSVAWWRQDLLLLGLALVLLPLAAMLAVGLARPRFAVTRTLTPDLITAGEQTTAVITIENPSGAAGGILAWRDLMPAALGHHAAEPLPVDPLRAERLPAEARRGAPGLRLRHIVRTRTRGVYEIGPVAVLVSDPFGLARREHAVGPTARLVVTPVVAPLAAENRDAAGGEGSDRQVLSRANPGADELIAREYRTGDPLRRVHWRATARLGELMVRQEEQHSDPEAWVLFDTLEAGPAQRRRAVRVDRDPHFEHAVCLVASLGVTLLRLGYRVHVVETARPQLGAASSAIVGGRTGATRGAAAGGTATFQPSTGERGLLIGLAGIERSRQRNESFAAEMLGGLRRAGGAAPVFAVLLGPAAAGPAPHTAGPAPYTAGPAPYTGVPDPHEAVHDLLLTMPALSGRATAFLAGAAPGGAPHEVQSTLTLAGWRVEPYPRSGEQHG